MYPGIKELVADNYFEGHAFTNFLAEYNITKIHSPAYRPQANGPTERVNRELRKLIPQLLEDLKIPWAEWSRVIPLAAQIINSTPHSITKIAPEILHFGSWKNELYQEFKGEGDHDSPCQRMWRKATERMRQARKDKYTIYQPDNYPPVTLEPGEKVWVNLNGKFLKATVVSDFGDTCVIKKEGLPGRLRYGTIGVHKSRISMRL